MGSVGSMYVWVALCGCCQVELMGVWVWEDGVVFSCVNCEIDSLCISGPVICILCSADACASYVHTVCNPFAYLI